MPSTVYRETERRERDRFDDSRTSVSTANRGYTTVKRYRIPGDDDSRSSFHDRSDRGDRRVEETRIVRREREREPEPEPTRVDRDIVIRREREVEEPRTDYTYERRREERREEPAMERELVVRRTSERDEPRYERYEREIEPVRKLDREIRYERDYELAPPRAEPYDLQRYSRSTEYFQQPPQTIVIRQEPQHIYIHDRAKDDNDYQVVRREDIEDRQVTRREPPKDEEYYYEKRVTEREGPPRRDDDYHEEREYRKERDVSPHDSVSQVGGRRDRDYSSDDSMVYVRKETKKEGFRERSDSPHHRRHVAEGALAGIGAAELLRHHHKKEGKETSGVVGRLAKDGGAGVLGAAAATAISRARSRHRSKSRHRKDSRSRSRSGSRERRRGRSRSRDGSKHRSKSRSKSRSKLKTLGGLGLGAAALATAVAVARSRNNDKAPAERRSRSRRRRDSVSSDSSTPPDDARDPSHRNKRMAQAGLAGATVAGLVERARSKSRNRKGERSRSRVRQGLPIVATGLGSAVIAGIHEKQKAKRKEKEARDEARAERRARSRSRSKARSVPYPDGPRSAAASDPGLIEYGDDPVYGNIPQTDYYGRPASQQQFYSDAAGAVVPAGAAATAYAPRAAERSRSRDRRRSSSSENSDHGRRRRRHRKNRSRSQSRDLATAGVAAVGAGLAASEYQKRKERKRAEKERRRYEAEHPHEHDPYEEGFDPAPFTPSPPPNANFAAQNQYYPQTTQFPPPPGNVQPPYNPQDYPPPPGAMPQAQPGYNPAYPATPAPDPYAGRRADENVSATANSFSDQHHPTQDGVNATASPSSPFMSGAVPRANADNGANNKSVQFDLGSAPGSQVSSPDQRRRRRRGEVSKGYETDDSDSTLDGNQRSGQATPTSPNHQRRHHRRQHSDPSAARPTSHHHSNSNSTKPRPPPPQQPTSPQSDSTVDLPDRFDKHGRKKPEQGDDPLADKVDELLQGKGPGSRLLNRLADGLFGEDEGKKKRR